MFYVIICPRCKTPRIIKDNVKTVTCFNCGKHLTPKHLNKYYQTENLEEAQRVLGILNARRDGREDEFTSIFKR